MSAQQLATVLLKIMGIYWIVSAVLMIPNVLALRDLTPSDDISSSEAVYTMQLLIAVLVFAAGVTLLLATPSIVRLAFGAHLNTAGSSLNSQTFQAVGLSLLGAWLLSYSLPSLASFGVVLLALSKDGHQLERASYIRDNWSSMLPPLFEAIVGCWLFLRSSGVAALWHRLSVRGETYEK